MNDQWSKKTNNSLLSQLASTKIVHPSKRQELSTESASTSTKLSYNLLLSRISIESENIWCGNKDEITRPSTRKHNKRKASKNLVVCNRASTSEAVKISNYCHAMLLSFQLQVNQSSASQCSKKLLN